MRASTRTTSKNGRKTGSTTGDTTCAADPPPGPATPDENPNRHLTRHPRRHPKVPVPVPGDLHLLSVARQAFGDGLSLADIHGGLTRAVSVLGPDDVRAPLGQRVPVELHEKEVAPVTLVTT